MSEEQLTAHLLPIQQPVPTQTTQVKIEMYGQNSHSSLSYIESNNTDPNNEEHLNSIPNEKEKPFQASISDIREQDEVEMMQKLNLGGNDKSESSRSAEQSQEILVKTKRICLQREDLPILKKRKSSFSKPYYNTTTTYRNNHHYSSRPNRPNSQTRNNIRSYQKHDRYEQDQQDSYYHNGNNRYDYKEYNGQGEDEYNIYSNRRQTPNRRYDTQPILYEIEPTDIQLQPQGYNNEYLNFYFQQQQMQQYQQQIQQYQQQTWINSQYWPNPYPFYLHQMYPLPIPFNQPVINNTNTTLPSTSASQISKPKSEEYSATKSIGTFCFPKFEIIVNNCVLSITCCKLRRLKGDVLLMPFCNTEEFLYPSLDYNEYWVGKQQIEKIIRRIKQQNMRPGEIVFQRTQLSSFKAIAFLKVTRMKDQSKLLPKSKDQSFINSFNRGLLALLAQAQDNSVNPSQPCREIVIPYTYDYGSTKQKLNKIIGLLKLQNSPKYQRITINCSDIKSFRRMCEGMREIIYDLDEEDLIAF